VSGCCDKIPHIYNIREEEFIWAHGFRVQGPLAPLFWILGGTEHHGSRKVWQRKVPYLLVYKNQRERKREGEDGKGERERERERERETLKKSFKGTPPVTYFLQVDPTS
jgi:hypothetical protein